MMRCDTQRGLPGGAVYSNRHLIDADACEKPVTMMSRGASAFRRLMGPGPSHTDHSAVEANNDMRPNTRFPRVVRAPTLRAGGAPNTRPLRFSCPRLLSR